MTQTFARTVAIVGTGFVADLYKRSFETYPDIEVVGLWDRDAERLARAAAFWGAPAASGLTDLFARRPSLVLNLTNPDEHHAVSAAALEAGLNVYSEKPLATTIEQARSLHASANEQGLILASAPCSALSSAAQTLAKAVREGVIGTPRLAYAELDDGFIPAAPYEKWLSETGKPWPAEDEFKVGCTLEHAGYYLTWLMAMFGSVTRVAAASADLLPQKNVADAAPDFSVATLFFEGGMVARLTCSIVARHDHGLRLMGDEGTLEVPECWANDAPVRLRRRFAVRRRLVESPRRKTLRIKGPTHPKVGRRGAASMNFALGPAEVLDALQAGRPSRLGGDFALHLTEVTLAIQNARGGAAVDIESRIAPMVPMPWAISDAASVSDAA